MAPLPQNSTPRYWVDYTDSLFDHSIMFRYPASAGVSVAEAIAIAFFENITTSTCELTIIGARVSASGSNISTPIGWPGAATYGTGAQVNVNRPIEVRFEGRSPNGRRANWSIYGWDGGVPGDYRLGFGDSTAIGNTIGGLQAAAAAENLLCVDGFPPVIYPYANIQYNSYWETQCRG